MTPTSTSPVGVTTIKVILDDSVSPPQPFSFTVEVIANNAPTFSQPLVDIRVSYSQSQVINTAIIDTENDNPYTIVPAFALPSIVTYTVTGTSVAITITPLVGSNGNYPISFILTDSITSTATYSFNVIINTAPSFATAIVD